MLAALIGGKMPIRGRERQVIFGAILICAGALVVLPFARAFPVVLVVLIVIGAANGPFDVAMFTLRQRRTDPAWYGRAFAVSMSLNWVGAPIGSALAGPMIGWSLDGALWAAVLFALAAAVFPLVALPAPDAAPGGQAASVL